MASSAAAPVRADVVSTDEYARRFGALLRRHRQDRSLGARMLANRSARLFSPADLRAHERGERSLDPSTVKRLCDLYGITIESVALAQHRGVVIDLHRRELRVGDETYELPDSDRPGRHVEAYVRIVNELRARPMRSPATVRQDDTEALAEALELDTEQVIALLAEVLGRDATARRRVLALRTGTGTLATLVIIGAATGALASRDSEAETEVRSSGSAPAADDEGDSAPEAIDVPAPADVPPAMATVPPSASVDGPNLHPLQSVPPRGGPSASPSADPEFEDETFIDAPGGPVTIEREDDDGDDREPGSGDDPDDETFIDAPGGPVTIEREDDDAAQAEQDEQGDQGD